MAKPDQTPADTNNSNKRPCSQEIQDRSCFDLDELLPQIGEFGRYQQLLVWLVCLPACIPCGFCAFNQLFMADVPDHWCLVPELLIPGVNSEERRQIAIPYLNNDTNSYSNCIRYDVNWTALLQERTLAELKPDPSWPQIPCDHGWEFNTSQVASSIVIDFNLVCSHDIYPTIGLAALNAGGPIGVYLFGVLNDRIGRRLSFFSCLTTLLIGNFLTAIAVDFWTWATFRFIVGLTIPAIYQIPFIISLELVGPNYRSFITVMTCLSYSLGLIILAGIAYFVRDWVQLSIVTSTPFLLYYIYWWFLPESPRWLLAKGRLEEGAKILETLARINKKDLPPSFKLKLKQSMMLQRSKSEEARLKKSPGVSALFGTPNMRLKTILLTLNWFANEMVYVGLSYYGPALGSDHYLSFMLASLVEIPSYLACWVVMDRWGRRWPLCISMILSGFSCIATVLLPQDAVNTTLALYLFSKFAISASFLIIYPFAGELYPTQLRGIGIGFSAYISGLGLIVIPFINYLGSDILVLPLVIMGATSVLGGLCGLRLPETLYHRLPQTVEEGEEFGKNFTCTDCLNCIPHKPPSSVVGSYEDLFKKELVELQEHRRNTLANLDERTRLNSSIKTPRLVRQSSVMETPKDSSGVMKMTYWF